MKEKTKITTALIAVAVVMATLFYFVSVPIQQPKCFFAGGQWEKQGVKFFSDPNNELKKVTYTDFVSLDPNSPDWGTWERRYQEFLSEKSITGKKTSQ